MKIIVKTILAAAVLTAVACGPDKKTALEVSDLKSYVDSVENQNANYVSDDAYWNNVEQKYNEKENLIEAKKDQLEEQTRKEFEELKVKYAKLKADYEVAYNKHVEARKSKLMLRRTLYGEGKIGDDMVFEFMTAKNALDVYKNFVTAVSANKDTYSREDWDEIKLLYEAMDTRKNEIEKDLTMSDNNKIAVLKIKFATINSLNRPGSKVEENADAKALKN